MLSLSCGGRVDDGQFGPTVVAQAGASGARNDRSTGGVDAGRGGAAPVVTAGGGGQGGAEFRDPGCTDSPTSPEPLERYECDPYATANLCGRGQMCAPFVTKSTQTCRQEVYGALCIEAGTGTQGDPCDQGCAPRHICVVSGQGTQCVRFCPLEGQNTCSNGLVCSPIDIPNLGGCL